MSSAVAAGARACRVLFDGQSLNNFGTSPNRYPDRLMSGRGIPYSIPALEGIGWILLKTHMVTRVDPLCVRSSAVIVVMCGGTLDYSLGSSGANTYANEGVCAASYRAAGADYVIGTTTTPSINITGGDETKRVTGNGLVVADASHYFDAVVDFAGDSRLDDPTDTTYYVDGTHPTTTGTPCGAQVMADLVAPALVTALTALGVAE